MKPILILYATREGQTRKIAGHVARALEGQGCAVDLRDAAAPGPIALGDYAAAVVAASVHFSRHEREMVRFVRAHVAELQRLPTAFLSVSMTAATLVRPNHAPARRERAVADLQRLSARFCVDTGWQPGLTRFVAGALLYTRYNFLVRWVMKQISKQAGGDTDTSRDYEYTDYAALDAFARELAAQLRPRHDEHAPAAG
jgi:menaquinone-dependent protoporphyrinogen oxidase